MKGLAVVLFLVFMFSSGLVFGSGTVEPRSADAVVAGSTPTQVAAYVALPRSVKEQPETASVVVAIPTDWASYKGKLDVAIGAAQKALGDFPKSSELAVTVQVALPRQKQETPVIILNDYPLGDVPADQKNQQAVTFAFSLTVPYYSGGGATLQKFPNPLVIVVTCSASTRPFFLTPDKKQRVYFDSIKPGDNPLQFSGKLEHEQGSGTYTITVDQWLPGDPCMGG
jgi:hypothetical protein